MKRYISLRTLAAVTASVGRDGGAHHAAISSEMRVPPDLEPRVAPSHDVERSDRASSPD